MVKLPMIKCHKLLLAYFLLLAPYILCEQILGLDEVHSLLLKDYTGKWYEIARLRNPWERACTIGTTWFFAINTDGNLDVNVECRTETGFHSLEKAKGIARVTDKKTNSKFDLSFSMFSRYNWVYSGDFWIIQLADDYSYMVASDPVGHHIWILSRTTTLSPDIYQNILDKLSLQFPNLNILDIMRNNHQIAQEQASIEGSLIK